ncbi:hypothetical protein EYF80_001413 [Liparis tanakae]|uniref:Uncharacterized protein n=1 Tax=Liparis tanakae TaxID=230148 RepID=A0A4Z2JDY6_9TELE|nr:hypothetical protein EYF80_001413 [Liparis tanakae]
MRRQEVAEGGTERAGGEPGSRLRGSPWSSLTGRTKRGLVTDNGGDRAPAASGASAIRIHYAQLVVWKGSRSCSSKPFEIICDIASPPPTTILSPMIGHSLITITRLPFPCILALTSQLSPARSLNQQPTTQPLPVPTGPVSQPWPLAVDPRGPAAPGPS